MLCIYSCCMLLYYIYRRSWFGFLLCGIKHDFLCVFIFALVIKFPFLFSKFKFYFSLLVHYYYLVWFGFIR